MALAGWDNVERRHIVTTGIRALATSLLVIGAYFVVPIIEHPHERVLLRLVIGLAFFLVALTYEVRAIVRSDQPILRAAVAMALVIPVFIIVFAWSYLTLGPIGSERVLAAARPRHIAVLHGDGVLDGRLRRHHAHE